MESSETKVKEGIEQVPLHDVLGVEMVDLFVGTPQKHYRVHKKILCQKIPYFDKMFNGAFTEAVESSAYFPTDSPESFDMVLAWVYSDRLKKYTYNEKDQLGNYDILSFHQLVDKLCLRKLVDLTVDMMKGTHEQQELVLTYSEAQQYYSGSSPNSGMRSYALDSMVYAFTTFKDPTHLQDWPLADLYEALVKDENLTKDFLDTLHSFTDISSPDPREEDNCLYHSHGKEEGCPLKKRKSDEDESNYQDSYIDVR